MLWRGAQAIPSNQFQPIIGNFRPISGLISTYKRCSGAAARVHYSRPQNAGPRLRSQRRIAAASEAWMTISYTDLEAIRAKWNQDYKEVEDDGDIYGSFKTFQEFKHFCRKKCVQPLYEYVGRIGEFGYLDAKYLAVMESIPEEATYHDEVRYVIDRYNFEMNEYLELERILHLHYLNYCAFMKIEVRDLYKCGELRTYNVAIWNKDFDGHSEIGLFKRVRPWTPLLTEIS